MKKYLILLSVILLFSNCLNAGKNTVPNITFAKKNIKQIYQEDLKNLSEALTAEIVNTNLFANERVKNMCKEWPTCEEWAKNKVLKDPTFKVIDAEVERYISKSENIIIYNFYVQTEENGKIKAYLLKYNEKGTSYDAPILIKKFPGHPIPSEPSQHIGYSELSGKDLSAWPGFDNFNNEKGLLPFGAKTQYVYKYDENGNALWKRRLYAYNKEFFNRKIYYFEAYQTEAGGDYTYKEPVQLNQSFRMPSYKEDLKDLSSDSKEEITNINLFANERVKNMCKEWPTCEEWAKNKVLKDPTFKVIDVEVERYITRFEEKDAIWIYNFYAQTIENGQTKAYSFKRNEKGTSYDAPILIKKFPGHPISIVPTERIALPEEFATDISWPRKDKYIDGHRVCGYGVKTQYIYKYDENGNALWKRGLYVGTNFLGPIGQVIGENVYYFEAFQITAGGIYIYKKPKYIGRVVPYPPHWRTYIRNFF